MAVDEEKEALFGEIAIELGLATAEQIEHGQNRRLELARAGQEMRLGEVLIAEGILLKPQALNILKEANKRAGQAPRIGGYELQRKLGSGAMGAVYLARQISMDRPVALKLLPRRLSRDPEYIGRFLREARLCARLNHTNIVRAIDVGESNGYHFFAMEYIDGETLRTRLKRAEYLEEDEALEIFLQAAQGLEHAAQNGIVHRDIKPANIMICKDGTVKIADLGLAIGDGSSSSAHLTATGVAVGTPYYMSPEQVEGKSDIDCRADIYALGATVFEMVTGHPPFAGGNIAAIMAKRLYEDPPIACEVRTTVTPGLSAVLYKMMAREPKDRYPDFAALLADLRLLGQGLPPGCRLPEHHDDEGDDAPADRDSSRRPRQRVSRHRHAAPERPRLSRRRLAQLIVFSTLTILLSGLGLLFKHAHALRGPRHPFRREAIWRSALPGETVGRQARALWLEAQNLHLRLQRQYPPTPALVDETLGAYDKLINTYPDSAYAGKAREREQLLRGRKNLAAPPEPPAKN